MKTRYRLLAVLVSATVLVSALSIALSLRLANLREIRRASQAAEELRTAVLLQGMFVEELVQAHHALDKTKREEISQLVLAHLSETSERFPYLSESGVPSQLPDVDALDLKENYRAFHRLWVLYRGATEAVAHGRLLLQNRDFVLANSVDLANRMTEVCRVYDRAWGRDRARAGWLVAVLVAVVFIALAVASWLVYHDLLRPLDDTISRMELMSSGSLPLEAQMPHEEHGELGGFSRHFNQFVDRLRESDQMKDRFLATMSHEIRTPLNGVIGFLGNLAETDLRERQRQYVRLIDSSARALLRVINEILDFSKLSAGKMELEIVAFDLVKLVEERIAVTKQMANDRSVKVRLEMAEWDNPVIRGDPTRLRQVLDNLLSNAVKFTEAGEVRLSVDHSPLPDGHVDVAIAVADTGVGISPEDQRRLFKAFAQAETSTTRRFGGTGLGLCIASNLVSLMGGKLQVESRVGEGARFSFTIRTRTAPPEEQVQLSPHYIVKLPRAKLKKYFTLLVDDTPTNLFLMETICQGIGLPYMTATNGKEAVDKCRQFKFDLIFMDIQMPVMDGYTAIREIRKLDNAATTQIIALTASAMQEDVEKALGVGSTGFVAKPFERNELLLCIGEHLGIPVERELRPMPDTSETGPDATVRQMYDFMREQYQISLGEIKLVLAQSVADWRPQLDDVLVFSKKANWEAIRAIMHRFKGQLGAIGLPKFAEIADEVNTRIKGNDVADLHEILEKFVADLGAVFRSAEQDISLEPR